MDLTACPECGNAAEIQWRDVLESTDGPIEHGRVVCVSQHWFVLPVSSLTSASGVLDRVPPSLVEGSQAY